MRYLDTKRVTRARWTARPHTRGRQDGYGSKLPTSLMLRIDGKRWRRVYAICWSNGATCYVLCSREPLYLATGYDPALDGVPTTYDASLER